MRINEEYKEIECIDKLSKQYKEHFYKIVNHYAPKLPEKILVDGSAYTLHDFNHHCINIYKIISEIILYPKTSYKKNVGLSAKELFILDMAVLFHDMGMSVSLKGTRKDHSRRSAEYIEEIYHTNDSVFRIESTLNENEIKALKLIVMAHSNIKDGSIPENENGLNNPELRNDMRASQKTIRANFLACVLRLADELDITIERLGNGDTEFQLNKIKEERLKIEKEINENNSLSTKQELTSKLEETNDLIESFEHWKRLHLFSFIYRSDQGSDEVLIKINDDYIKHCCDEGDTYERLVDNILEVYSKINIELKNGLIGRLELEKNNLEMKNMISVASFKLISDMPVVNKLIAEKLNCLNITEINKSEGPIEITSEDSIDNSSNALYPKVIDKEYQNELSVIVKRRDLLKVGHFLLDEIFCARDWIDTKEIVETPKIIDEIITFFIKHINTHFREEENYLILGLDMEGAVLASRVGMALQKPFSYLIPAKEIENNAKKDIEIVTEKYEKYVILTDAIVTYETIKKICNSIKIGGENYENILQIYTIFYRVPLNSNIDINKKLINKTSCISSSYTAELFEKNNCPYKEDRCFGMNRKLG